MKAAQAEERGRQVPPTQEGYTRAATARGHAGIVEALISRHNQRWSNVRRNIPLLSEPVAETLHVVFPLDVFLWQRGVRFAEAPSNSGGGWPGQLRWGLDSACQVSRMLMACNPLGAAAIARTQLERWSYNRSFSNEIEQEDGVATADHYTMIWGPEGPMIPAGSAWTSLSELLHGRGPLLDAVRWESIYLATPGRMGEFKEVVRYSLSVTQLSLRQVLLCIVGLAQDANYPHGYTRALLGMPLALPSEVRVNDNPAVVWPLTLQMLNRIGDFLAKSGTAYLSDVEKLASRQKPRHLAYSARSLEAFVSRRSRATSTALNAFEAEKQQLGERFHPGNLAARELAYIGMNEAAAVLASWMSGPVSDALMVASCALRAAFWMWLEDDDRCLILARTVIEQTARLRAWRVKPEKAEVVEGRGSRTSARDWLEAAGWRRLSILNRSLGEFSHASPPIKWDGARSALSAIQEATDDFVPSEYTARGNTLDQISYAFGSEISYLARQFHPALAAAFESILPYAGSDGTETLIEKWLERCWAHRGLSF